jgi:hypothetical protein
MWTKRETRRRLFEVLASLGLSLVSSCSCINANISRVPTIQLYNDCFSELTARHYRSFKS